MRTAQKLIARYSRNRKTAPAKNRITVAEADFEAFKAPTNATGSPMAVP